MAAPSKALNITLWVAQIIVAVLLLWAASVKLLKPINDIPAMWPWAGQVSSTLVRFTGVVDLLGALGLILPPVFRLKPILTPLAAVGVVVLMICASIFHISRGEGSQIGINIVVLMIAAFIAWGRFKTIARR